MNKYFYPIFKLPTFYERDYVKEELPLYVKWWLLGKAGRKLSEILTGSEFTLLHTLNKKFKILQIKGNTEQEQLSGKNLFNKNSTNYVEIEATTIPIETGVRISVINNTQTNASVKYIVLDVSNYANKKMILKAHAKSNSTNLAFMHLRLSDSVGNFSNNFPANISSTTTDGDLQVEYTLPTTIDETYKYLCVSLYPSRNATTDIGNYVDYTDLQLEEGGAATSYEPYCGGIPSPNPDYPQQIKNVTGQANVKIQNKNLSPINSKTITVTTNSIAQIGSINGTVIVKDIPIKNNEKYYISGIYSSQLTDAFVVFLYNGHLTANSHNGAFSELIYGNRGIQGTKTTEITNSNGYEYMAITMGTRTSYNANTEVTINIENLMVTTLSDTTYVPHQEQNLPFTFSEGQRGMQGTTLQDDGIHQKRIQIDLSLLTWRNYDSSNLNKYQSNKIPNMKIPASTTTIPNLFAEKYIAASQSGSLQESKIAIIDNQTLIVYDTTGTPSGILEYELATEEIIPYNATQASEYNAIKEAHTYKDVTYISGESEELPPLLEIQYWKERGAE